ncbi:Os07g0183400 [Oryza sativa Japonica Group]|uniref:Os07g0183400 protein n=1 Tax=Oryza sativa subsp. japonica TaxID=39947 RepID=A0A0P0X394_ORYSJ|nr:Os07g0183400 [Oryza sativa Japonica Group]
MWAKASDLYCEEADRDDDDGLAAILHDAWELPTRPVLRNVFRRLPRNTDFDGATFLSKPWLALAVDGHNVVADGRFHDIAFPHDRGARCVGSSRGWLVRGQGSRRRRGHRHHP